MVRYPKKGGARGRARASRGAARATTLPVASRPGSRSPTRSGRPRRPERPEEPPCRRRLEFETGRFRRADAAKADAASLLDHVHVERPAEEQVLIQLIAELPLAAGPCRAPSAASTRAGAPAGSTAGRPAHRWRRNHRYLVGQLRPQRARRRHPRLRRHPHRHRRLLLILTSHRATQGRFHPREVDPC
jgi:hypothetical protein